MSSNPYPQTQPNTKIITKPFSFSNSFYYYLVRYRYCIIFLVWISLCCLFPYTGDDWAWGSQLGLERLYSWFNNYNGRYLGNLIVLALTRSSLLRTLVMTTTLTGIAYCSERLVPRKWVPYIVTLAILLSSRLVFRQAVVWTAGFSNYSVSIFLTLIIFVYLNDHFNDMAPTNRFAPFILFLLGLSNCLIVEHFTVFHMQLSLLSMIVFFILYHKPNLSLFSYAVGCGLGTILMFSNSAYHSIAANEDGYRSMMGNGIINRAILNYFGVIYRESFLFNWFVNTIIIICCFFLFRRCIKKQVFTSSRKALGTSCCIILALFEVFSLCVLLHNGYEYTPFIIYVADYIGGILTAVSLISMITLSIIVTSTKSLSKKLSFLWYAAVCIILPLFEVNPIGSRCFLGTYIIMTLIMCELLSITIEDYNIDRPILLICVLTVVIVFSFYEFIFIQIHQADKARLSAIQEAVSEGKTSAELAHLPYDSYLWTSIPVEDNDIWEDRYKLFYGIPEDFDLLF